MQVDIQMAGTSVTVPAVRVRDRIVFVTGSLLKIARVMDEEFVEGETLSDPAQFADELGRTGLKADVFTFAQKIPDVARRFAYRMEWDNFAVVPITTYEDWWEKRAEYDVRKAVKRAKKLGVVVKAVEFDDDLVQGICGVYNESSVRQGSAFWHYQKAFDQVKKENSTFLDRSIFIGAYLNEELIGFIRMVYVGSIATTLQVISQKKHYDKKATNALIAKAIEICVAKGASHLVYGSYLYGNLQNSLTEFKRRNGFEQLLVPRYYVPLTTLGRASLALGLHQPLASRVPKSARAALRKVKRAWQARGARSASTES
jgi:hypothetical protein